MNNLMFPKPTRKKKRNKHKKSIVQNKEMGYCFLCAVLKDDYRRQQTEEHHVFMGSRRQISEENGFKVHLCLEHHRTGKDAVHHNIVISELLKTILQKEFESNHSREEFFKLIGKNYLQQERDGFHMGQKVHYKRYDPIAGHERCIEGEGYIYSFTMSGDEKTMWISDKPEGIPKLYVWQCNVTAL